DPDVAPIADLVCHGLAGLRAPRRDHDVGTLARECERDPPADALTRAGDDRRPTVEPPRATGRRHGAIQTPPSAHSVTPVTKWASSLSSQVTIGPRSASTSPGPPSAGGDRASAPLPTPIGACSGAGARQFTRMPSAPHCRAADFARSRTPST